MNTHNVRVKTATTETTETWVKQKFDVLLLLRADRLLTLAQLEGNLMMYRALAAMDAFGPDHLDDLLSDVRYAAERITTMLDEGDSGTKRRQKMKRLLLACLLMAGAAPVLADDAQSADAVITPAAPFTGWHWYNEPKKKPETPAPKVKPPQPGVPDFSKLTPSEQADVLKGYTKEALNNAILHPSAENTATFLRWQKFWTDRASMFSQSFAVAQLDHPDLDYNLEHPHYNSTAPLQQARDQEEQNDAIKKLSGEYGLFYFYRGQDPIDAQMAGVVADFARLRHISLIPVSVDGTVSPQVPDSRTDAGQTARMGITHFPALFLVDPKSKNYRPLAYGFMTQDDLAKRFLNVATGFKPNF